MLFRAHLQGPVKMFDTVNWEILNRLWAIAPDVVQPSSAVA
jgi:hypothetical protein